uniref:KRAB domain-containing protein n=1 Tax=Salvator merianae TaxID=96440 RepID=A0A8D0CEJ7_SALMN
HIKTPAGEEEVAVHFTDEEWPLLHSAQRALHREIMEENYQNLASLGKDLALSRLMAGTETGTVAVHVHETLIIHRRSVLM